MLHYKWKILNFKLFIVAACQISAILAVSENNNSSIGGGVCFVPDLQNVITKNDQEVLIPAAHAISNGTKLHFSCPTNNWLIGKAENLCHGTHWETDFPFCQSNSQYIYTRVLIVFALLFGILIFVIYWARKTNGSSSSNNDDDSASNAGGRRRGSSRNGGTWNKQKLYFVEQNELTPMSSTTTLNTSQV